jgi:carboxylesterase type B
MLEGTSANCSITIDQTTVQGFISDHGVANYLGLKYASIPARFRTAKIVKLGELGGILDARHYGPCCPQPANLNQGKRKHLFADTRSWPPLVSSEFDCLNLNIYAPPPRSDWSAKVPVVVWIHGGGFLFGAGGPEYGL